MLLKPQGFYGYVFLFARTIEIVLLATITGLVGHFIAMIQDDKQTPAVSLIVALVFTAGATLWTALSWNGYSKRCLSNRATWAVDLILLLPSIAITTFLGMALPTTSCDDLAIPQHNNSLSIQLQPAVFGQINFAGSGQTACDELFIVWELFVAVCSFFAISAASAAFWKLDNKDRVLKNAVRRVRQSLYVLHRREQEPSRFVSPNSQPRQQRERMDDYRPPQPLPRSKNSWGVAASNDTKQGLYQGATGTVKANRVDGRFVQSLDLIEGGNGATQPRLRIPNKPSDAKLPSGARKLDKTGTAPNRLEGEGTGHWRQPLQSEEEFPNDLRS
ncbi:hypothetical protein B0T17DRAFT_216271 [Bombardia bombarda]|uniref:MARVEL domain-containing protein n=1 Tax=Bombardia bombarda TaxID=252184 RepID=A0AA39XAA2_9PEZI|nr:hypothetical protein B0T17DRAFT_216271 [Bombardia bombarda]